jgi:hypothetical protein
LWWSLAADPGRQAPAVTDLASRLYRADEQRRADVELNLGRWGIRLAGLHRDTTVDAGPFKDAVRINIVKSVVETLTARIGSQRPRPFVLTSGGDYELKTKAKQLQRFFDGAYEASEIYQQAPIVFRDALICGTGVIGFSADAGTKTMKAQRVLPLEVLVDPREAVAGNPRQLVRVEYVDKDDLIELYPHAADEIEDATAGAPDGTAAPVDLYGAEARVARVTHAWRKASYTATGDNVPGQYALVCNGAVLASEEWPHDYFPFEFLHWSPPVRGFWGSSAVTEVRPLETETNHLLQMAQQAMRLCGNPMVLVPTSANLKTGKLTNEIGIKVEYDGQIPPQIFTPQPISPTIIEAAWTFKEQAYAMVGTNELGASGVKPAGIESGRALETLGEESQTRFKHVSQHFEHVIATGCARQFLRLAQWLDDHIDGGFTLKSKSGKQMIKLAWSKVAMSPDDFFVSTYPSDMLPLLPGARIAEVERLGEMGVIDQSQMLELLDFPDIESVSTPLRASFTLLEQQLDAMLSKGEMQVPDERQNLEQCLSYGTAVLLSAIEDGAKQENVDLVRDYLSAVEEIMEANQPPTPPAMDPTGALAPADPAAMMPPPGDPAAMAAPPPPPPMM